MSQKLQISLHLDRLIRLMNRNFLRMYSPILQAKKHSHDRLENGFRDIVGF